MKKADLLKKKNVVRVTSGHKLVRGLDTGRLAIVVYVTKKLPLTELTKRDVIPHQVEGVETDVQESSPIRALATPRSLLVSRTSRQRPAPGGVSAGHFNITAGSTGPVVRKNRIRYSLSNSHVYADSGNAQIHDPIYQPGPHDGGTPNDIIAHLAAFAPINFLDDESNCSLTRMAIWIFNGLAKLFHRYSRIKSYYSLLNKVDCAIGRPLFDQDISNDILEIGVPTGFNFQVKIGDAIRKSGRTTGVTQGIVVDTEGLVNVYYGDKIASFEDQIIATPMAEGGDSGSAVLNDRKEIVGLLFAGSDTLTIINKIGNVIDALELDK